MMGRDKKVLMFTSTNAHEGKSFLVMNTMRTLAELGNRVVVVDADLRRSQIAVRFGMRVTEGKGYGLTHFLAGRCAVGDIIYETDIPRAHIIPVGQEVSNSLTLLNSRNLGDLLRWLREKYDYVLVDAPPVGVIIDAAEIAKSCDGSVLVLEYNKTHRRALAEAKQQMERTGTPILGCVLNKVTMDRLSTKKYYSYGGHYGYGRYGKYGKYGKYGRYDRYGRTPAERELLRDLCHRHPGHHRQGRFRDRQR
jgi:capsular exopolysaccharide synthesis family protein